MSEWRCVPTKEVSCTEFYSGGRSCGNPCSGTGSTQALAEEDCKTHCLGGVYACASCATGTCIEWSGTDPECTLGADRIVPCTSSPCETTVKPVACGYKNDICTEIVGDPLGCWGPGSGTTPTPGASCGNGSCDIDETCSNCPADCGDCPPGYTICENWASIYINDCSQKTKYDASPRDPDCITQTRNVTLHLSSSNATKMGFANVSINDTCGSIADGDYSGPYTYASSRSWTLTTGDGQKKVCARFINATGANKCGALIQYASPTPTPTHLYPYSHPNAHADLTCFREELVYYGLCPREHLGWQRRR